MVYCILCLYCILQLFVFTNLQKIGVTDIQIHRYIQIHKLTTTCLGACAPRHNDCKLGLLSSSIMRQLGISEVLDGDFKHLISWSTNIPKYLDNHMFYDKIVCTVLFNSRWWVYWYELFGVLSTLQKWQIFDEMPSQ